MSDPRDDEMETVGHMKPEETSDAAAAFGAAATDSEATDTANASSNPDENDQMMDEIDLSGYYQPNPNVTLDKSPFKERTGEGVPYGSLFLPSWTLKDLDELYQKHGYNSAVLDLSMSQKDVAALPREVRDLREKILTALLAVGSIAKQTYFHETLQREGSSWGQGVVHDGQPLRTAKSQLNPKANPVLRINNMLGLTGLYQIPLWHTGIWLTLTTPMDASWLEMERRLANDKTSLGRESNGRVFSAHEIYTMDIVIDFILSHVHSSTAPRSDPEYLRSIIRISDIPSMLIGMATAQYPSGYPFQQPCLANPGKCDHVVKQVINLAYILWVDSARLTDRQKKHMAGRVTHTTDEALRIYQSEFTWSVPASVAISQDVTLEFEVPTLKQFQDTGYRWVAEVRERTNRAFATKLQGDQREEYMRQWARFETLRQYGHYFKAAVIQGDANREREEIVDPEQIDEIVTALCNDQKLVATISKTVNTFIDHTTVAMVAIPREVCPKCGEAAPDEYLKHPHLIPLDAGAVFFNLSGQRIRTTLAAEDPL